MKYRLLTIISAFIILMMSVANQTLAQQASFLGPGQELETFRLNMDKGATGTRSESIGLSSFKGARYLMAHASCYSKGPDDKTTTYAVFKDKFDKEIMSLTICSISGTNNETASTATSNLWPIPRNTAKIELKGTIKTNTKQSALYIKATFFR